MAMPPPAPMPGNAPPPPEAADLGATIVAQIPEPKGPGYKPKVVQALAEQLVDSWTALKEFLPDLPDLPPVDALLAGYAGEGKLPEPLVVSFVLLLSLADDILGGGSRYAIDIADLVDDRALGKVQAQLDVLAGDKKVRKAVEAAMPKEDDESEEVDMKASVEEKAPIPKGVKAGLGPM